MPRRPVKLRRAMLVVTLALLAIVLAAWGVSFWKAMSFSVQRIGAHADAPSASSPQPWVVEARQVQLQTASGVHHIQFNVDRITYPTQEGTLRFHLGTRSKFSTRSPNEVSLHTPRFYRNQSSNSLDVLGVWMWNETLPLSRRCGIAIACWELALLISAVAAVLGYPLHRRAKRLANNQCPRCGYDRKGLAPGAGCPECRETPKVSVQA